MTFRAALLLALTACGGGAQPRTSEATSARPKSAVQEAHAASHAPAAGTTDCATDADCRAFGDGCGGCVCRPLRADAPEPKCGSPTACFADPCRAQRPLCREGRCALEDQGER